MKTLFIILIFLVLGSCKRSPNETQPYMDISVIGDYTDIHILKPEAKPILGLYNLPEHRDAEINFRYHEVSDKILVPVVDLRLPDGSITRRENRKNEPLFREKMILSFYDTVTKTLNPPDKYGDSSLMDYSECFNTIAFELNLLAKSNSRKKVLFVFSNLFENSGILSVYTKETKSILIQNPKKIADQFEKTQLLPENLKGVTVFFVFKPRTRDKDLQYLKMIEVYTHLLEPRGAKMVVQANNSYYRL